MPPLNAPFAREGFTGTIPVADLDGRTADGDGSAPLALGVWNKQSDVLAIDLHSGVPYGVFRNATNFTIYALTGLSGFPAVHGAQTQVQWTDPTLPVIAPGQFCAWPGISPIVRTFDPNPSSQPRNGSAGHDTRTVWWKWNGGSAEVTVTAILSDGFTLGSRTTVDGVDGRVRQYWTRGGLPEEEITPGFPTFFGSAPVYCNATGVDTIASAISSFGPTKEGQTFASVDVTITSFDWSVTGGAELYNRGPDQDISQGYQLGYASACVRWDDTVKTGYEIDVLLQDFGTPVFSWELWEVTSGTYKRLKHATGTPPAYATPFSLQLDVDAADLLTVYFDGVQITTFDPHTELAENGTAVAIHAAGTVAIGGYDDSGLGAFVELLTFTAHGIAGFLCNAFHVMDNLDWREGTIPPTGPTGVLVYDRLTSDGAIAGWVMDNLAWRPICPAPA